jgi:hypothetical protein
VNTTPETNANTLRTGSGGEPGAPARIDYGRVKDTVFIKRDQQPGFPCVGSARWLRGAEGAAAAVVTEPRGTLSIKFGCRWPHVPVVALGPVCVGDTGKLASAVTFASWAAPACGPPRSLLVHAAERLLFTGYL